MVINNIDTFLKAYENDAYKSQTVATLIQGVVTIVFVLVLSWIFI